MTYASKHCGIQNVTFRYTTHDSCLQNSVHHLEYMANSVRYCETLSFLCQDFLAEWPPSEKLLWPVCQWLGCSGSSESPFVNCNGSQGYGDYMHTVFRAVGRDSQVGQPRHEGIIVTIVCTLARAQNFRPCLQILKPYLKITAFAVLFCASMLQE